MDFDKSCESWGAVAFDSLLSDGGAIEKEWKERIDAVNPDGL